jgi:CRP/FNR family cyclic AMP-dependent transcriptional regulator
MPDVLGTSRPARLRTRLAEQRAHRTRRETAAVLGAVPLFVGLSRRHLERLAAETDELRFEPGQHIVQEGEPGETLYVVLSGEAKVVRRGRTVARMYPGDVFGELSALDGGPRTASVVAVTPVEALRLFRRTLLTMLEREPGLSLRLLEVIVRRLRQLRHPVFG